MSNHSFILCVLEGRAGGFYDAIDFVDRAVESTICYETRQFAMEGVSTTHGRWIGWKRDILINKVNADAECATETFKGQTAVGFKQLVVCQNPHLADIEPSVRIENPRWDEIGTF